MRQILFILILFVTASCVFFSCAKWQDPAPVKDPRLDERYYCNDPEAVNYNWGFPGTEKNSLCFYPTDLFMGTYLFYDSVYKDTLFIRSDSFIININPVSTKQFTVSGFCMNGNTFRLTADASYVATVDTVVGDSTTLNKGQFMCRTVDTVVGTILKDRFDSSLLRISLQVASDTGITTHYGSARKQQ